MKCGSMPSLIHHADNRVQAAGAGRTKRRAIVAADGARQSWRRNAAAKTAAIVRSSAARSAPRSSSDCGYRSVSAGRSGCCMARNQPLKSAAHSSLAAVTTPSPTAARRAPAGALHRRDQPGPLEDITDRRSRRPAGLGSLTLQDHPQLARSQMWEAPAQRMTASEMAASVRCGQCNGATRMIHKPFRRIAFTPLAPLIERVPAYAIATAQIRNTPVAGVVFGQHSNALFRRQVSLRDIGSPPSEPP